MTFVQIDVIKHKYVTNLIFYTQLIYINDKLVGKVIR